MPEMPQSKIRPQIHAAGHPTNANAAYAELHLTSNFSFLRGGSHPEELVARAAELGYAAVALTDINTLAGIVRAHEAAQQARIPFLVGCHLQLHLPAGTIPADTPPPPPLSILMYPTHRAAYARLCRLLTADKRRAPKGQCTLTLHDVIDQNAGSLAIVLPPPLLTDDFTAIVQQLRAAFDDDRLSLAATCLYDGRDNARLAELHTLARRVGIPLVATQDVHYHAPERQPLQDVLTCIRLGCTIHDAGFALFANAERHMKSADEIARLFRTHPHALHRTLQIAQRAAAFSLGEIKYEYPTEVCPPGKTPMQHLIDRTWQGARERYPAGVPASVRQRIEHELVLIRDLNYPAYFLTVDDIVSFARSRHILCQGRGAAANSAVCYCLGITAVDPARIDLLVERFISRERDEPPDIDIDFEHERREEVIQYLYAKYGRDRAALTAEVITYRRRSAVREVGKALGLSLDCVDKLAKTGDWWDPGVLHDARVRELGLDPRDPTLQRLVALAGQLLGFPRHLSQHVGGFVISRGPLCETVPIENAAMPDRTVIEWDKDDIDAMGILKVDILALGMLTAIRKTIDLVNQEALSHQCLSAFPLHLHTIPPEDPAVYDMLCRADSVGVFQVESRAQMTMLPRLKPRCYYDLVIEVAIVRPGPIQGGMVHPYLRRRNAGEQWSYPNDRIKAVLERTLGVPLFQEQAMRLVMVAAGFSAGEADQLRRAMAAWKRKGDLIHRFAAKIVSGMTANGYTPAYAHQVVEQIKGFSEYGFPESHAASFALLVYVSSWLKLYHPAAFAAALINSQPMGFYPPAQIIRDARRHGVTVLPVDVNHSTWDCTLEPAKPNAPTPPPPALRLGMRLISGLYATDAHKVIAAVAHHGPFDSVTALWRTSGARVTALRTLAAADAFRSLAMDRQAALWAVMRLRDDALPMFDRLDSDESPAALPSVAPVTQVIHDYAATGLSLKAHPMAFVRKQLTRLGATPVDQLTDENRCPPGKRIAVAGLALVRQRPATAGGILFMTIEDEAGVANLIIRPAVYERYRRAIRHAVAVVAWGKVERQGQVVHVLVDRAADLASLVHERPDIAPPTRDFR